MFQRFAKIFNSLIEQKEGSRMSKLVTEVGLLLYINNSDLKISESGTFKNYAQKDCGNDCEKDNEIILNFEVLVRS